ncbi:MAG: urease accessory protein UreD [Leptolyngbya sp. IPPAS B-1204]
MINQPLPIDSAEPQPASTQRAWRGSLSLQFERRDSKTILSRSRVQAPLKVQRPFYPEGDSICHSVMLHTAGGVVGGDQLAVQVQVEPQAHALLTTAAATKVYRSNGLEAQQTTQIRVAPGACLEWLPQETIVFDGARYRQNLRVELADQATWLGWEISRLGRSARGERFTTGEWRSRTEVWQNQRLIWTDPQWIQGGGEMLESLHGLAGHAVIGSLAFVGASMGTKISDPLLEKLRSGIAAPTQMGVTRLSTGVLCRYRGDSTAEARHWFGAIWNLLRQDYLERPSCVPRVWQV